MNGAVDLDAIPRNEAGFASVSAIRREGRVMDSALTSPALVVVDAAGGGSENAEDDLDHRSTMDADSVTRPAADFDLAYQNTLAFLVKRPGNPFPQMISVGRAANSDIVLALGPISKVHGYFLKGLDGDWSVVDQRSRNGIFLNQQRLEPGQQHPVKDGDTIRFGEEVTFELMFPEALLKFLRGG